MGAGGSARDADLNRFVRTNMSPFHFAYCAKPTWGKASVSHSAGLELKFAYTYVPHSRSGHLLLIVWSQSTPLAVLDLILRSTSRRSASHDKPICGVNTSLSLSQFRLSNQASSCHARGTFQVLIPCATSFRMGGPGHIKEAEKGRQTSSKSCPHSSSRHHLSASTTRLKSTGSSSALPKSLLSDQSCAVSAFAIWRTLD